MDARPFRPRGAENMEPSLHQRHKSTGNLFSKTSTAPMASMRGPAKRAAFGDVTNTTKHNVGVRDGRSVHKVQSALHLDRSALSSIAAKENAPAPVAKDTFSRPVQKLQVLPTNNKLVQEPSAPAPELNKDSDAAGQVRKSDAMTGERLLPLLEEPSEPLGSVALPARQPRHHQSQPQLKKPQPTLRKTQSRQLERIEDYHVDLDAPHEGSDTSFANDGSDASGLRAESVSSYEEDARIIDKVDAMVALPQLDEVSLGDEPGMNAAVLYSTDDTVSDEAIGEQQQLEAVSKPLPEIREETTSAVSAHDGLTSRLSETDEHWYDDDYYDDDQGGTTTQSRDMTGGVTTLLQPKVTSRVQQELAEAMAEVEATRPREDIEDEAWDVSMVAEYGDEIFQYLREMEEKMLPNAHYMDHQTEIQWSMRSVLMEWLVQVHGRFHLLPETLFLTVNYVDRFLSSKVVSIGKLQLVGATAILLASKYEEINCPSLQEIIYMVDGGYSAEEVLKAERFMLSMLGFELGWPGPMSFLRRVSKADDYDYDTRTLAKYFLELTIMDERFVASTPSYLAAGAHCLARLVLNKGHWTKHHVHYSGYTWSQIKPLVTTMIECCEDPDNHHRAIFDKYAEKKFKEASLMVQSVLDAGFTLPHDTVPVRARRTKFYPADEVPASRNVSLPTLNIA